MARTRRLVSETATSNNDDLMKKLVEIAAQLGVKVVEEKPQNKVENKMEDEDGSLNGDTYIKVMSITPYWLTLTTEEYGKGKKFDFKKFGEVKRILYRDLTDIIENHANFLEEGYFIIMNREVVRKHGLDDLYTKILTKEKLESIISGNDSDAVNMFKACGDAQRDFIVDMFHEKMIKGEFVDLNLLDRLSRIVGYNIAERGEEKKKLFATTKE